MDSIGYYVTAAVALYGAVVSTVALLWNVRRDRRDTGRLQIDLQVGRLVTDTVGRQVIYTPPNGAGWDERDAFFVRITNVGRRPIMAQRIEGLVADARWFRFKPRRFRHHPLDLPKNLEPGYYVTEAFKGGPEAVLRILRVDVIDSTGKRWRTSRRRLRHWQRRVRHEPWNDNAEQVGGRRGS